MHCSVDPVFQVTREAPVADRDAGLSEVEKTAYLLRRDCQPAPRNEYSFRVSSFAPAGGQRLGVALRAGS